MSVKDNQISAAEIARLREIQYDRGLTTKEAEPLFEAATRLAAAEAKVVELQRENEVLRAQLIARQPARIKSVASDRTIPHGTLADRVSDSMKGVQR